MKNSSVLLCYAFFLNVAYAYYHKQYVSPKVDTTLGKIQGSLMTTRLNKTIYAFRGIRYAEPPVGDLRFRPPVPVKPWTEPFDASQEGPGCPQPSLQLQSEDCLRLNVYTTKLPSTYFSVTSPVIVFFHPGGFYMWSGQTLYVGPNYIMDQEVVLVSVNYRLGSLGFLSTGDALAPGNNALKDQVLALRWVQQHIEKFGGNPNSVTIAGCSAGAGSFSVHLVSPLSQGLFHRAIAMSGSAGYQNRLPTDQKNLAVKQAQILGCPSDTTRKIIDCLKTKTAEELGNSLPQFAIWHSDPVLIWSPVVEPDLPGVERFLPAQPADLIREGKFHHVPVLAGITAEEFGWSALTPLVPAMKCDNSIFDDINANWTKIAPISFLYEPNTERSLAISKNFRKFYTKDEPVGLDNWRGLSHLYADAVIGFSVHRFVNLLAGVSREPVWYYKFTYQGRYSFAYWPDGEPFGVVHQDDLMYLFWISSVFPLFEDDAPENVMVEKMTSIWGNFAKTGRPIPTNNQLFENVSWKRFTPQNKEYLDIGDKLVMKTHLHEHRMNEWEKLFPLAPLPSSSKSTARYPTKKSERLWQNRPLGRNEPWGRKNPWSK